MGKFSENLDILGLQFHDGLLLKILLKYGCILLLSWVCYKAFLEPFLSPLRKIPGTTFNPIFGDMKALMTGEAMEATLKLINKHGALCRYYFMFGRERLIVADPNIIKQITVLNCRNYIKPPSRMYMLKMLLGEGLVMSEGSKHEAHKRLISPSFNNTAIRKMIGVFERRFTYLEHRWTKQIDSGRGSVLPVAADVCRNTLDIIGETAFSYDFKSLDNPDLEVGLAFQRILQGSGLNWRFLIPFYFKLPFPDVKKVQGDLKIMQDTVDSIIKKKSKQLQEGKADEAFKADVLGMMMLAKDDSGVGMSHQELKDQVMTMMLAGHETTAQGISWILLKLAEHQDVQSKVRDEINQLWNSHDENISWEMLENMKYSDCVIKETLRMYPPVPLTLREAVNDDTLSYNNDKYQIPKGTILLLSIGPMMRRPELFSDPDKYYPDRFFDEDLGQAFYKYMPFLIGPRMCLGYKFAMMEMKMAMAVLLRKMCFTLVPGQSFKRKMRTTMRPDPSLELLASKIP